MVEAFLPGEVAYLAIRVTDMAGMAIDPPGIALRVKQSSGFVTSYAYGLAPEIIRDGLGQYHANILLTSAGQWAYRWELGAPNAGAAEGVITVLKSRVI